MEIAFEIVAGAATLIVGAGIIAWVVSSVSEEIDEEPRESLLAPVLMADILDPDLHVLYARSMVLDAMWKAAGKLGPSPAGRELRRYLVDLQAGRVDLGDLEIDPELTTEIAAIGLQSSDETWAELTTKLKEKRRKLRKFQADRTRAAEASATPAVET